MPRKKEKTYKYNAYGEAVAETDDTGHVITDASTLAGLSYPSNGTLPFDETAFKKLESYMMKHGQTMEKNMIKSEERQENMRKLRSSVFQNIEFLLDHYRSFAAVRNEYLIDLTESITGVDHDKEPLAFDELSHALQLLDARDEREFKKNYQPYIEVGLRLDYALKAIDYGIAHMRDCDLRDLLRFVYMDGDSKPSIAECCEEFDICKTVYYRMLNKAKTNLTMLIFGPANHSGAEQKRNLLLILMQMRVEEDPEYFDDYFAQVMAAEA